MIAGGIATDNKDQICMFDVIQDQRRRPCAKDAAEPHATRLMAIKRTIVDIIRPEDAGKNLQQKPRFIRASATEIPEGFIGFHRSVSIRRDTRLLPYRRRSRAMGRF